MRVFSARGSTSVVVAAEVVFAAKSPSAAVLMSCGLVRVPQITFGKSIVHRICCDPVSGRTALTFRALAVMQTLREGRGAIGRWCGPAASCRRCLRCAG
jgi:hypothetical protein